MDPTLQITSQAALVRLLRKNSPANVNKVLAAILNLVSFSLFDRRDSDKPEDGYTQAP